MTNLDLTGLSPLDCPYDCNPATGCVITGSVCGHPFKGGLQGALQGRPEVVARFQQARKVLHNKRIELTSPADPADAPKLQAAAAAPKKPRAKKRHKQRQNRPAAQPSAPEPPA